LPPHSTTLTPPPTPTRSRSKSRHLARQTASRFTREAPRSLVNAFHTLVGNPTGYGTKAVASGVLNLCISVFAMVWVTIWGAQLTSNLTVAKLAVGVAGLHELETAQLQLRTGPACSLGGAAYTGWLKVRELPQYPSAFPSPSPHPPPSRALACSGTSVISRAPGSSLSPPAPPLPVQTNYPLMDLNEEGASISGMKDLLESGACDSMLTILPAATRYTGSLASLVGAAGITMTGNPLKFGPQDFAVGVRRDMPEVAEALSYWINALRLCQPGIKGSACEFLLDAKGMPMDDTHPDGPQLGENMDILFRKYHGSPVITKTSDAIGPDNFILAFVLAWGVCGLALLWELCQLRFRDRVIALARGSGLWKCVTGEPFNAINPKTGNVSLKRLRCTFKARTSPTTPRSLPTSPRMSHLPAAHGCCTRACSMRTSPPTHPRPASWRPSWTATLTRAPMTTRWSSAACVATWSAPT
jgi:hypothetical protein